MRGGEEVMPIHPSNPNMLDPQAVEEHNRQVVHRDIELIREKLQKFGKWEMTAPMFRGFEEWKEYRAIEEEYSSLVLQLLEDEVILDPRYAKGDWGVTDTLLDLIRKGLEVKK
jgi:hypothetical protein